MIVAHSLDSARRHLQYVMQCAFCERVFLPMSISVDVSDPYRGCVTLSVQKIRLWDSNALPPTPTSAARKSLETFAIISGNHASLPAAFFPSLLGSDLPTAPI